MAFPWPAPGTPAADFGTDGGAHNFLRYLESGGTQLPRRHRDVLLQPSGRRYLQVREQHGLRGPDRDYNFDTDFLDPAKLPPLTPVFRDINSLGFAQEIRPGK